MPSKEAIEIVIPDVDPMPDAIHFIGLTEAGTWVMSWGPAASYHSLAFETFGQVMQWCKDFGVKRYINFDKRAAVREIIGNAFVADHYSQTPQQVDQMIADYEMKLWGGKNE